MRIFPDLSRKTLDLALNELFRRRSAAPLPVHPRRPVILYGAGQLGRLAYDFLRHVGVSVRYVLDQAARPGQRLNDAVPVYSPTERAADPGAIVLVSIVNHPFTAIASSLRTKGWKDVRPFYDYAQHFATDHPLNNGWFSGDLSREDRTHIRRAFQSLADLPSQAAYLHFLAWRLVREDWVFPGASVSPNDKYLIPPVRAVLHGNEDIIDIGAYDGRFLTHFLKPVNGAFSSARLFEPDPSNAALLQETVNRLPAEQRNRIQSRMVALSDRSGTQPFELGFGMACRLSDAGVSPVPTVTLDELALSSASYVKIHVEGAEINVLRGSVETLRRCRPIVVVTNDHNRDGLWKILTFLKETLNGYDLWFRAHIWGGTGAVAYAVPQERQSTSAPC